MMLFPKSIIIGPYTYKVIENYRFKERRDLNGQCDSVTMEIRISEFDDGDEKYTDDPKITIFLHEVLHAIQRAFITNRDISEDLIEGFAVGLQSVMKDNPEAFINLIREISHEHIPSTESDV